MHPAHRSPLSFARALVLLANETVTFRPGQRVRLETLTQFQRAGLRCNPFRVLDRSEFAEVFIDSIPELSPQRLIDNDTQTIQIIGRSGHGKSSLLAALQQELETRSAEGISKRDFSKCCEFIYLPPERYIRVRRPAATTRFLLIDEAQRLSRRSVRIVKAWCQTSTLNRLILATHLSVNLSPMSSTEIYLASPTRARLQQILKRRIEWASLGDDCPLQLSNESIDWLLTQSGGNMQLIERVLYDVVQTCIEDLATDGSPNSDLEITPELLLPYSDVIQEMCRIEETGQANAHQIERRSIYSRLANTLVRLKRALVATAES
jgi:energy-coupling factor transporter ATP-binding protein EcfA2